MNKARITNRLPQFSVSAKLVMNDALKEGAKDILILSKTRAPFDIGGLRVDTETGAVGPLHWRVSYWKEYARFQEFGGDNKRKVSNYTTPGTGKHYLKSSGDQVAQVIQNIFRKHGKRAKA